MDSDKNLALFTDLYELTMAQAYLESGKTETATFSLFVRSYSRHRSYFVAAGLEDVLGFLQSFQFGQESIEYLRSTRLFNQHFLNYLKQLRFTGEVRAIPEGRLVFANEPLLEITAPLIESQIVETFVINQINLQTLIATKAARCVHAAAGRTVVDFSLRRTHGTDAGMKVARSSYLAGFGGTSNVLAGERYRIPVVGTMAHSYVLSFEDEIDAFRSFVQSFSDNSILLIDTYDVITGARKAVQVAREMASRDQQLKGVRIDSGDLDFLARQVRRIFDEAGLKEVKIIGSGGLDEYDLADLSAAEAPFDSYGVGTKMGVSADAPWLDMAYKLVQHDERPVLKLSPGKASLPGRKQVFRFVDQKGHLRRDVLSLHDEDLPGAEPLLKKVMEHGRIVQPSPGLDTVRKRVLEEFKRLDQPVKAILDPVIYPVELSPRLERLKREVERQVTQTQIDPVTRRPSGLGES